MDWFLDCCNLGTAYGNSADQRVMVGEQTLPILQSMASMESELDEGESMKYSTGRQLPEFDQRSSRSSVRQERQDFLDLLLVKHHPTQVKVFDTSKKIRSKTNKAINSYRKNICGYITRRITREFLNEQYDEMVEGMCAENDCDMAEVRNFYLARIETITGLRHLSMLFKPQNRAEEPIKKTFKKFFRWFLKERYVRYLIADGKMTNKRAYVEYKNRVITSFLDSDEEDEPSSKDGCRHG